MPLDISKIEESLILVRVTQGGAGQAEVPVASYADLDVAIKEGLILPGRYVGSNGEMSWRVNAALITGYLVEDDPAFYVSQNDESATRIKVLSEDEYVALTPEEQALYYAIPEDETPTLDACFRLK